MQVTWQPQLPHLEINQLCSKTISCTRKNQPRTTTISNTMQTSGWKSQLLSYSFTAWNVPKAVLKQWRHFSTEDHLKSPVSLKYIHIHIKEKGKMIAVFHLPIQSSLLKTLPKQHKKHLSGNDLITEFTAARNLCPVFRNQFPPVKLLPSPTASTVAINYHNGILVWSTHKPAVE